MCSRSMMQEFSADEATFGMDDQFMLGPAILVKPVTEAGQQSVSVYLPPSAKWYHYESFEAVSDATPTITVDTKSLATVPVFLRGGQIVARKDRIRRSSALTVRDPFTLVVALDSEVRFFYNIHLSNSSNSYTL